MFCKQFRTCRHAALCAGLGLAFMAAPPLHAAEPVLVKIDNFSFAPATLVVRAGTTVTFENDDDIPHLVVASDGSFRSKALDTGDSYSFTAGKAGDYPYFCGLHPHMQGTIKVTP
ncbi:MAG: cupredoxin domain-containing protein [Rhizobiaceae bacterium]|jgi:plastocyanin